MASDRVHRYRATCEWTGSTAAGYDAYDRSHTIECPPARAGIAMSADPAFKGAAELANPEQLLLAAAVSCQLLSFLAVAARRRIEVVSYTDDAEAEMPEAKGRVRISSILLRPTITVASGTDEAEVLGAVSLGHKQCYVANSLNSNVTIEPEVVLLA